MTEQEIKWLLKAAEQRPLLESMTVRRGKNKGKPLAKVRKDVRRRLELLGWERALIYKTLILTGLRKGELTSLTVGNLQMDGDSPYIKLLPTHEKNRQGSTIPLKADLAADIGKFLGHKLEALRSDCRASGRPIPAKLPATTPLFRVPVELVKIFDKDLVLAKILKVDEQGMRVDVHALRHTFGTHLSKAGVPLRTAQAAMRHSDPSLTANVYIDPRLLDVAGAVEKLPNLPLDDDAAESRRATGT